MSLLGQELDLFCLCLVQIIVTVWKQEEEEKAEIQEHGYLSILQQKSPCQTFRQDLNTFKAQGKCSLSIDVFSFCPLCVQATKWGKTMFPFTNKLAS